MIIPATFKTSIANAFYDKEVILYNKSTTKSNSGWTKFKDLEQSGTFFGNVNFNKLDAVQEAQGIEEQIDMTITTNYPAELNQIIGYEGIMYIIIRAIKFDSHYLLIAKKWLSKSSTSISV